jgi:hypothetical protein
MAKNDLSRAQTSEGSVGSCRPKTRHSAATALCVLWLLVADREHSRQHHLWAVPPERAATDASRASAAQGVQPPPCAQQHPGATPWLALPRPPTRAWTFAGSRASPSFAGPALLPLPSPTPLPTRDYWQQRSPPPLSSLIRKLM